MKKGNYLFTSESVTEGHPDKVCDQISDSILDAMLAQDSESRVAVECLTKTGFVVVAGEVTTTAQVEIQEIARKTIEKIGYDRPELGFEGQTCGVLVSLSKQSPEISMGVSASDDKEQGAGDQGLMFGYATNETETFMPLPITLAHKITMKLSELRKNKTLPYLRPDGKSQVTVEYDDHTPKRIEAVVVAAQHDPGVEEEKVRADIIEEVIKPVCKDYLGSDTVIHINSTGRFVIGGPVADAGLTGRKIICDTYGGVGSHGGGCFSGKDPSKVDRSASYMARYIAKNIVAAELADRCEVQLAYAIGVAEPVSILINTFGTNKVDEEEIVEAVRENFSLTPAGIIKELDLKKPIYEATAAYGHFGREGFSWEKLDKAEELKKLL